MKSPKDQSEIKLRGNPERPGAEILQVGIDFCVNWDRERRNGDRTEKISRGFGHETAEPLIIRWQNGGSEQREIVLYEDDTLYSIQLRVKVQNSTLCLGFGSK